MSNLARAPHPMTILAQRIAPHLWVLLLLSVGLIGVALYMPSTQAGLVLLALGVTMLWIAGITQYLVNRRARLQRKLVATIAQFVEHDASPSFTTDGAGLIGYQNRAAVERFGGRGGQTLLHTFGNMFASPGATLYRLQNQALAKGAAREDVVVRRGHLRLAVHQIGDNAFLWRLEDIAERSNGRTADGVSIPMMSVSKSGTVLFMNEALRRLLGGRENTLDRIINDLPLRPGDTHEIAAAEGNIRAMVAQIESIAGRREIYILPEGDQKTADWNLLDALPVPLLKIAPEGQVLLANRPARELLNDHGAAGQLFSDLVEDLGRPVGDWLRDTAEGRALRKPEFVSATRSDSERYLQVTLNRVVEAGEVALIAVLNDATELKTLEQQFVQSQKMQAIGQLAGGIAHDFNNLLTAISGHCDLLLLRHDKADQDYGDLIQINQNANRAAALVSQLLAFSRKQTLKPTTVDLRDSLSDLTHLLNRLVGEKVSLTVSHDPDLRTIRADKRQIEQVIMNLVVNGRDAMPEGGEITIETRNETLTESYERDRAIVPAGEYVVVKVSDQGTGIAPEKQSKIFEPFYTTKATGQGTGLGLSTAYGIVKQTGGFIFVDSVLGAGTAFTLFLPAYDMVDVPQEAPSPDVARPNAGVSGSGVVLLVEDEAPVRAFASRALRMRGYTVIEAEDAEDALKTLEDTSLKIDVFVTDVIMPGMDGPSWVSEALKTRPGVKVVFVSGYAEDSFSEQQARIPNSVFLPKPFSLNELTATVGAQIH